MPRQLKREKPYIVVFCEGESEQAYTDFLKKEFKDVASIKRPSSTGLFEEADSKFKKDKSYRDYAEVTDGIWFFFDLETKDIQKWDYRFLYLAHPHSSFPRPLILADSLIYRHIPTEIAQPRPLIVGAGPATC